MKNVFWCIGGGVLQQPLISQARKLGYSVLVTDGADNCACANLADLFYAVDIFDIDAHIVLANEIKLKHEIVGVLAAGIDAPVTMSKLAEHLGLPGVPSQISEIVHYKSKFRDFCNDNGIDTPFYRVFGLEDLDTLSEFLDTVELPFIIKNVDSSGSRGTKIFYCRNNDEEQRIAKEAIEFSKSKTFLVESVWIGQECTVETLYDVNGKFHPCFITDRMFDYSTGYPIEIGLVSPSQLSSEAQTECFALAEQVANKLGINTGAAKFDIIYTQDGPRIIEMTTRLSGGFDCQYLVPSASGKNIMGAAILTACGREFPLEFLLDIKQQYAVSKSHWPENGKIVDVIGVDKAIQLPGVEHIFFRKSVGDVVEGFKNCVDRVSFIIATGATLREAEQNAHRAIDRIELRVRKSA
jgi:biotin carboxylase